MVPFSVPKAMVEIGTSAFLAAADASASGRPASIGNKATLSVTSRRQRTNR